MVEPGSVINGQVVQIAPYGIWLQYQDEKILVMAPEISWKGNALPSETARVGDFFDVFVLRYNYRDKVIVGSIKKLHPEENPYRELSRLLPGTRLSGRLDLELADDVLVLLENGARGNIPKKLMPSPFGKNEMVDVVISALDVEQGQLTLEPVPGDVRPVPPSANQPSPDPMLA